MNKSRQIFFWALLIAVPAVFAAIALPWAWQQWRVALQPAVVAYMAANLSETEKQAMRQQLQDSVGGMFMEIPEPLVGRVASPGYRADYKEALVTINNAGMRSEKNVGPKSPDVFRVVCLGDSFVFGTGVSEQVRFCNQLEQFYQSQAITVAGKRIEALAWRPADEGANDAGLGFDHGALIAMALAATRREIDELDLPFGFLPERFTLGELQAACEQILGRRLDKSSFRRKLDERKLVEPIEGEMRTGAFRPAQLYQLNKADEDLAANDTGMPQQCRKP